MTGKAASGGENMDMDQHRRIDDAETFLSYAVPGQTRRQRAVIKAIESLSGHTRLHRLYNRYCSERNSPEYSHESFFDSALRLLNVDVRYDKTVLERVPRDKPEVPTVMDLWTGADWHERETYDLVGVIFTNREELQRILLPRHTLHPCK